MELKGEAGKNKKYWDSMVEKTVKTVADNKAEDIKNENYELYVYTVNSVEVAGKLYSMGVDGIFTDMPDIFF